MYVPSVSHFSQSEGSNVFQFHHTLNVWHVFLSTETHERLAVKIEMHTVLHTDCWIPSIHCIRSHWERVRVLLVFSISHVQVLLNEMEFAECKVTSAITVMFINVRCAEFLRVIADDIEHFIAVFPFRAEECLVECLFISGFLSSVGVEWLGRWKF